MLLLTILVAVVAVVAGAAQAQADPRPSPSGTAVDPACAQKAAGSVAWCMPWAAHVDKIPPGGQSHWVTQCSKAVGDREKESCAAASVTLKFTPDDGSASVFMDGPSTGKGAAGLINCPLIDPAGGGDPNGSQSPQSQKRARCELHVSAWAAQMYDPDPKQPDCPKLNVSCKFQRGTADAVNSGIHSGIQGLVDAVVQGTVWLLSRMASWVFSVTAISSPDEAFYSTYNSMAGVLIVLIFVFFIVSTVINGLRTNAGPGPLSTLGGLVRAVLGITFAGGIAYTIVAAWDQATNAVITANADTPWDPSKLVTGLTKYSEGVGTLFLALILAFMATIGLFLLFVIMLFRGLLATGAALFGAMAMTGQVMPETRHWGRRWFWTVNALGSSKFFIAELWIYGSRSAYESDDFMNALRAVLLIWLMVAAPFILLRLTTMWDGYLSDVNAHGVLSSAGNPLELSHSFLDGVRSGANQGGSSDSGGGDGDGGDSSGDASSAMEENSAEIPTTPDGPDSTGGGNAAEAATTGEDGGKAGQPAAGTGEADKSGEQQDAGDNPNTQEADGIAAGNDSAQHDLNVGQLTAPGDTTGDSGSVPFTPQGAQDANPTGAGAPHAPGPDSSGATPGDSPGAPAQTEGPNPTAGVPGSDDSQHEGSEPSGSPASGGSAGAAGAADVPVVPA